MVAKGRGISEGGFKPTLLPKKERKNSNKTEGKPKSNTQEYVKGGQGGSLELINLLPGSNTHVCKQFEQQRNEMQSFRINWDQQEQHIKGHWLAHRGYYKRIFQHGLFFLLSFFCVDELRRKKKKYCKSFSDSSQHVESLQAHTHTHTNRKCGTKAAFVRLWPRKYKIYWINNVLKRLECLVLSLQ